MNPNNSGSLSQKDIAKQLGVSVDALRRLAYERLAGVKGDRENCEIISQLELRLRQGSAGQAERNNFAGKQAAINVI